MSTVSIAYDLGQNGLSSFRLTVDDKTLDIGPFGCGADALGHLIRAALMMAISADRVEVSFDGEHYEWLLSLEEDWEPELSLRVEGNGEVLLEGRIAADDFARAVQKAGQGIWDTYKAEGYNDAWNGPRGFPLRALKALDAALSCDEPSPPKG